MIKLVLTDMDETLLVDFHVPAVNREAIAKVRSRGVRVAAATGRSFDMVQEILAEMGTKDAPGVQHLFQRCCHL
ncbi:MAG: HAD family hydrolase [Merdibacter sp.]